MLRDVEDADLPLFFEFERDPQACFMAAFTREHPDDRQAFEAHWAKIRSDPSVTNKTILYGGQVVGSVAVYPLFGEPQVTYWIGREYWGRSIATRALSMLLTMVTERPIYARAAWDNVASLRVLEKCGFKVTGSDRYFANARGEEIEEKILELKQ